MFVAGDMRGRRTNAVTVVQIALLILATAGVVAGTAGASGPPGAGPSAMDQSATPNGTAEFDASITSVQQDEAARLEVTLEDTRRATVVVAGPNSSYNVTVTLTDENGDGVVPLEFRTGSVGMQSTRFRPTDEGDDYGTLTAAPDPDGLVPVGEYQLAVYAGHGVEGEPTDVGTLVVNEQTPPPNASIDGGGSTITLRPEAGQAIAGTTELAAGRNVTVRLRSSGQSPFLKSQTVEVAADGTFTARFDLSGVSPPANGTATVLVDGEQIAGPADVAIVPPRTSTTGKPTDATTTPGQPGFGVAAAVVALLGGMALGRFVRD